MKKQRVGIQVCGFPIKPYKPSVAWNRERLKLKVLFQEKKIIQCEIQIFGCWKDNALGFAHKYKRIWYLKKENRKLLGAFDHVLLACNHCHQKIEGKKELTEALFKRLRK